MDLFDALRTNIQALPSSDRARTLLDSVTDLESQMGMLQRRVDALERVSSISGSLTNIKNRDDVDAVLNNILTQALSLTRADRGLIVLKDDTQEDGFAIRASHMQPTAPPQEEQPDILKSTQEDVLNSADMQISRTLIATILEREEGIITTNAQQDTRFSRSKTMVVANIRSVMATPIWLKGTVIGGIYVDSQFANYLFHQDDLTTLSAFANHAAVTLSLATSLKARRDFNVQSVRALVNAVEAADAYTAGHSSRVGYYARGIGKALGLSDEDVENLLFAGYLHDVGKIALTLPISKPGPLSEAEWEKMRQHTLFGERILSDSPALAHLLPAVRSHHERWTGGGYPDNLVGEEIPHYARVIAVADSFDAMTTNRPYRRAYDTAHALQEIAQGAGTLYCPRAAQAFCKAFMAGHIQPATTLDKSFFEALSM